MWAGPIPASGSFLRGTRSRHMTFRHLDLTESKFLLIRRQTTPLLPFLAHSSPATAPASARPRISKPYLPVSLAVDRSSLEAAGLWLAASERASERVSRSQGLPRCRGRRPTGSGWCERRCAGSGSLASTGSRSPASPGTCRRRSATTCTSRRCSAPPTRSRMRTPPSRGFVSFANHSCSSELAPYLLVAAILYYAHHLVFGIILTIFLRSKPVTLVCHHHWIV